MHRLISLVLLFCVTLLLIATYFHSISAITQDLGRHILMGKIILETMSVPSTNLLSYTYPDFPFINHHWLSQVVFYLVYTVSGFTGTLFVTALSSITALLLLIWYAHKKSSMIAIAFVSFLSLGILYERTDVRPESFSYLFFSIFLVILFTNRAKRTKWLFLLVPLQLIWTNMHVYFAVGLITIGLFLCEQLLLHRKELMQLQIPPAIRFFSVVFLLCGLMNLLNPSGISGAIYPYQIFTNYGYTIQENQNIFFLWEYSQNQTIAYFVITVLLFFFIMLARLKHTHLIGWLLGICFTILAAQTIRNFPLFVIAIFIPFSYHLSALLAPFEKNTKLFTLCSITVIVLLLWQLNTVLSQKPFSIDTPVGAAAAVTFFQDKKLQGPVFNNFDIGSYLAFRLYPQEKVFVDGRPESYPASFFQNEYIPMQQDPKLFAQLSKKYKFTTIIFSHTDQTPWAGQFLETIVKNSKWKIVYLDPSIIILTRKESPLPAIELERFIPQTSDKQDLYQLLVFFARIQYPSQQIDMAKLILEKHPSDCLALSVLTNAYTQTQDTTLSFYPTQFQIHCQ